MASTPEKSKGKNQKNSPYKAETCQLTATKLVDTNLIDMYNPCDNAPQLFKNLREVTLINGRSSNS